jgi:RND family efflux transporter MFP subunit
MLDFIRTKQKRRAVTIAVVLGLTVAACSGESPRPEMAAERPEDAARAETDGASGNQEASNEGAGEGKNSNRVTLTEAAFRTARILVEVPGLDQMSAAAGGLQVPGQVEFDPARVAYISPRTGGRIERLLAVPGDRVEQGEQVAFIQSPAFTIAQNDLLQALRRIEALRGTADAEGAQALLDAAKRRLALLGASDVAMQRLESGGAPEAMLAISAPFTGSIVESGALAGQAVESGTPLYKIADLSVVNIAADVPERLLPAVRVGQAAMIIAVGASQTAFAGRVTRVSDVLDPERRTAKALIAVTNAEQRLKPGMFASVSLRGGGAPAARVLTVPSSAVVTDGATRYVFVELEPRTYERRTIEIASGLSGTGPASARVNVISGLNADDRVVVRGAFTLKSELAKASLVEDE